MTSVLVRAYHAAYHATYHAAYHVAYHAYHAPNPCRQPATFIL